MQAVEFYSGDATVSGWLYLPSEPACPGAVFAPGFTGTKFAAFYQPYVDQLVSAGTAVLLIDYRGWGESGGERGRISPLAQVADIRNALSYLETRSEVDARRLGVLGVSFGGGHATYVASIDRRVRAAVAVSAVGDGEDWLRQMRRGYEWREFLDELDEARRERATTGRDRVVDPTEDIMIPTPERRATNVKGSVPDRMVPRETALACADEILDYRPRDVLHRKGDTAILWICVDDDVVVPSGHSRSMFQGASEPKGLIVLPGRSHYGAYVEHADAISQAAVAWFAEHL